ncbi:transmembrane emp24 domain-containing protein 1-like [Sycon ciliatum]|uniref:transmembrane emp24 domain-containing protein 1-like n=1 Tax=Sycon ciliatum TaxID=27933 RepID=UPI0020ABEAA1|eukprot:scpid81558/ scgid4930/ Transmembrane emp24 domain-containing protein 1; p24 family protein gamma-1
MMHFSLTIVYFFALLCSCHGKEYYWTVKVMPGLRECFYETVETGTEIEAEFQLLSGSQTSVDFEISAPNGRMVYTERQQSSGAYDHTAEQTGDYEFCINNQFGSWGEKLVFLDLAFDRSPHLPDDVPTEDHEPGHEAEESAQGMGESLRKVGQQLDQVRTIQEYLRVREARHRHTADDNFNRVLVWSVCECAALIFIGSVQVFVLRKFFENSGKTTA